MLIDVDCDLPPQVITREYAIDGERLAVLVEEALSGIDGGAPVREASRRFRLDLRLGTLLMGQCTLVASIQEAAGAPTTAVELSVRIESSRLGALAMATLVTTGFGMPLAQAWREASAASARRRADELTERFFASLGDPDPEAPYR